MLYVKENGVLIKLDSWEQVYARPNFIKDLDLNNKSLKALIGYYKNEPPRECGIKSCHRRHMKGGIVVTEDNFEASIGHMCGSKIFKEKFDALIKHLEKEVDFEIYKEAVASRKARVFEYWNKAAALTAGKNGILKLAEKILSLKDPLVAGRFAATELVRMAANNQTKVTKETWVEKEKKELTEEEIKSGEKKYRLEMVPCGTIKNIEVLLPDNDLNKIYKNDIEPAIRALEQLDLQQAAPKQIQSIGRAASVLDTRLDTASRIKVLATGFLTRENLLPLYDKMLSMNTVSRKDLELYENLINTF